MVPMFVELVKLFTIDLLFVGLLLLLLVPLARYKQAAFAVLKRNFISYFSTPTGYVFLCLFVLLTSFAAFWPHEFFNANLANLDQLNKYLPYIMLVFIPAITMSIWADERRQGTDELLLTLPADDFDIVIGKYLAAAAIFTASLLFSQLSNFAVLISLTLGELDTGLLLATYMGYWLTGLAMIAVGMVASFLTHNLTVGFILGVVFNAPLAFAASADVIVPSAGLAYTVSSWSIAAQFDDFGRGVVSLSSMTYFLMVIVVGLYLCIVLIGRRHWLGGRDGHSLLGHYAIRTVALVVIALGANAAFSAHDLLRYDSSSGKVSSLSPETRRLIRDLDPPHPVTIEAFVSGQVPELYVQTKFELLSMLKEFQAMAGNKVTVRIHDNLEPFSEQAALAEQRFDILPQPVRTRTRGAIRDEEVILGAAFTCGLEKVVVPFFDYGIPVEYELLRSISTVAQQERKTLGVVRTDAQLYGGFSFAGGQPQQLPKQAIVEELEKQYHVEEVDPGQVIEADKYDVLLVVQPSSLGPAELDNVVEAIQRGQPAAIFEDPRPTFMGMVPGTGEPKRPPGGMMGFQQQQPSPKGDIQRLWNVLGIEVPGQPGAQTPGQPGPPLYQPHLVWQRYSPYRKLQILGIPDQWVFAAREASPQAFNPESPITSGLQEVLFPVPGAIRPAPDSQGLQFTKLVTTSDELSGTIPYQQFMQNQNDPRRLSAVQGRPSGEQILAARIQSGRPEDEADEQDSEDRPLDVVYVADIDLMASAFLRIRARPDEDDDIRWRFDNVTFLLNVVDALADDDRYIEIRKRKPRHSTLKVVEARTQQLQEEELEERVKFEERFNENVRQAEEVNRKGVEKLQQIINDMRQEQREGKPVDPGELQARMRSLEMEQRVADRRLSVERQRLQRERDSGLERIRRQIDLEILKVQNEYKFWAVVLPPLPPLLVGLVVFLLRRLREREGISKARLR